MGKRRKSGLFGGRGALSYLNTIAISPSVETVSEPYQMDCNRMDGHAISAKTAFV